LILECLTAEQVGAAGTREGRAIAEDEPASVWVLEKLPAIAAAHPGKVYVMDQLPGEVAYTPTGWWHAAWNLAPCNTTVTGNFVRWSTLVEAVGGVPQGQDVPAAIAEGFGLVGRREADLWLRDSEVVRRLAAAQAKVIQDGPDADLDLVDGDDQRHCVVRQW